MYLRGVAYRRQLVRGRSAPAPSVGGWRDAPARATAPAAPRRTPAGGATAPPLRRGRTDSLGLQPQNNMSLPAGNVKQIINVYQIAVLDL